MIIPPLNGVNFPEMPYIIVAADAAGLRTRAVSAWAPISVQNRHDADQDADNDNKNGNEKRMGRILLAIVILLLLGILGMIGYAYLGDLTPATQEQRMDVTLPGGASGN